MFNGLEDVYDIDSIVSFVQENTKEQKESKIKQYIYLAHHSIINYLNADPEWVLGEDGKGLYAFEVMQLTIYYIEEIKRENAVSKKQGERSISYATANEVPVHIQVMLPLPYARSI